MNEFEELVYNIEILHLQNNTEKIDFDRAFRFGIEVAVKEMLEYTNERVIEELQQVADGYMGDDVMSMEYIINRIQELKQE